MNLTIYRKPHRDVNSFELGLLGPLNLKLSQSAGKNWCLSVLPYCLES